MSPALQSLLALLVVAAAAAGLLWRTFHRKRRAGCGGDCGCPAGDLKSRLRVPAAAPVRGGSPFAPR